MMDNDVYTLFRTVGACHRRLKDFAFIIKQSSCVTNVTHWLDIYDLDGGSRVEEYVDAELLNGEAISWRLEITLTPEHCVIEADVRKIHKLGQDLVADVSDRTFSTVAECAQGLMESLQTLIEIRPLPT
jgi:hypothetical protein